MASDPDRLQEIYARQSVHFTNAFFYKPRQTEASSTPDLAFVLAPLFLRQAPTPDAAVSPFPQVVYYSMDTARIGDRTHPQITYFWPGDTNIASSAEMVAQAVRITLDSAGQPVVWEILRDPSGLGLIFVAQSIETAASRQFGEPLAQRRYSVERSLGEAGATIVPRVIEDGPVPMGPVLYLQAGSSSVDTLICRCMPAQATTLTASFTYDLLPASPEKAAEVQALFGSAQGQAGSELAERLRLPSGF